MAGTNDFKVFDSTSTNITSQAAYIAGAEVTDGFSSGTALSPKLNKVWRQGTAIAAVIGQFICDLTGANAADDGTSATNLANFKLAINAQIGRNGDCRLIYMSTTQIRLIPYNGIGVKISGIVYPIPSGGVNLANTSLTALSFYNIYVYNNAGTLTLEATSSGHSVDTTAGNVGVEIKTGDNTRTLVGAVYMAAGTPGTFSDTYKFRGVATWFNRLIRSINGDISTGATTVSMALVELDAAARVTFLSWGSDTTYLTATGIASNNTGGNSTGISVGPDGVGSSLVPGQVYSAVNNQAAGLSAVYSIVLSSGNHYATVMVNTNANTSTFWLANLTGMITI